MPRDSRRVRQLRRLKRERTNALKMLDHVLVERNTYRQILLDARKKYIDAIIAESQKNAEAQATAVEAEVVPESREVEVPKEETWNAKDEHLEERHGLE